MALSLQKSSGYIVLGKTLTAPHGIDLRLEGAVLSVAGEPRASGTGVEVMDDPLDVVAFMASKLAAYGKKLSAGMVLITGTLVKSVAVTPEERRSSCRFHTIGKYTRTVRSMRLAFDLCRLIGFSGGWYPEGS